MHICGSFFQHSKTKVGKKNHTARSGVARALIGGGGGGAYSYIRVLPDGFLLK